MSGSKYLNDIESTYSNKHIIKDNEYHIMKYVNEMRDKDIPLQKGSASYVTYNITNTDTTMDEIHTSDVEMIDFNKSNDCMSLTDFIM